MTLAADRMPGPKSDRTKVTCLWESDPVESIKDWVDITLGDSSENVCYSVDADQAFAERPLGLPRRCWPRELKKPHYPSTVGPQRDTHPSGL